jgi:hypothetical protein
MFAVIRDVGDRPCGCMCMCGLGCGRYQHPCKGLCRVPKGFGLIVAQALLTVHTRSWASERCQVAACMHELHVLWRMSGCGVDLMQ